VYEIKQTKIDIKHVDSFMCYVISAWSSYLKSPASRQPSQLTIPY
jgi:hypothetical protein